MKLFQIITLDGEFNGKFNVDMDYATFESVDEEFTENEIDYAPSIDDIEVYFCQGDMWSLENPTSIDEIQIKEQLLANYDKVHLTFKFDDFILKIIDDEIIKDRISIRKEDRVIYESIRKNDGDLKGISNMDLFLMAMMLGVHEKGKQGLKGVKSTATDGLVRVASFTDDAWNIIRALAVYEEEYMEVLLSNNKMFDVAEKYATVGINELNKLYFENEHNFLKRMEKLLIDEFNALDIEVEEN